MSWLPTDIADHTGRRVVVTGANTGLGLEITRALAARGAEVVMACRDTVKADAAAARLRSAAPEARVEVRALDLADLDSVASFADGVASEPGGRLDLLVNNAGLMALDESRTAQGFETQFGVNHLGHFALTARLLPLLLGTPGARIGTMSSIGHRTARGTADPLLEEPYDRWRSYDQSKLANLLFTAELQRRLSAAGSPVLAVAAHPGLSDTELGTEGTSPVLRVLRTLGRPLAQSAELGARPMLRALTDTGVRGGEYYGPRFLFRGAAPIRETPTRAARDPHAARALWDRSVELTGVEPAVVKWPFSGY